MRPLRFPPPGASVGLITTALAVVLLGLVACGEPAEDRPSAGGASSSPASYEGTWELVEGSAPEGAIEISRRWRITLTVAGEEWGGLSACNYYGLSADVDGDAISVRGVGGTEMGCHPEAMETETRYHSALMSIETIKRSGNTLTLEGPDAELVFAFVPPPPFAELTNVRWELESLIHGFGPDAMVSNAHPSHLHFTDDGTFEGSTGCRAVEGDWIEQADRVTFTYFGAKEGHCSPALSEQNDAVLNLGDGFTFAITGDTLTIYGRFSDLRLEYKAQSR